MISEVDSSHISNKSNKTISESKSVFSDFKNQSKKRSDFSDYCATSDINHDHTGLKCDTKGLSVIHHTGRSNSRQHMDSNSSSHLPDQSGKYVDLNAPPPWDAPRTAGNSCQGDNQSPPTTNCEYQSVTGPCIPITTKPVNFLGVPIIPNDYPLHVNGVNEEASLLGSDQAEGKHQLDPFVRQANIIANIWPEVSSEAAITAPEFCHIYEAIKQSKKPNYKGVRCTIPSGLNLEAWEDLLRDYHDKAMCEYLRYGWPIGYHRDTPPADTDKNHASAEHHDKHVSAFITKELSFGAILGPFSSPPFCPWTRCSPIMTRPKKESAERRVIVDLSFPEGEGVNAGIDTHDYYGVDITYTLPTISDLVTILQREGRGALVWKADLARAYRQLRVDPLDCPLLGMKLHGEYYIDLCPPFGCKTSSAACQRMSNGVVHIMAKRGYQVLAYLDDYAAANSSLSEACESFNSFKQLAKHLGLELAPHKCRPPATDIEWLGYRVNTKDMTVAIPDEKMEETLKECARWMGRSRANLRMLQSLAGRLLFLANAITPARKFVARIISTLKGVSQSNWTTLSQGFKLDLLWFLQYSKQANGVLYYTPDKKEVEIQCDSSLTAGGGCTTTHCYAWVYTPAHLATYNLIHHLEAINLLVAYHTLARFVHQPGVKIVLATDNISSSYALQSGRTADAVFANCARELWLAALTNNHDVIIRHKYGHQIPLADALSRQHNQPEKAALVKEIITSNKLKLVKPHLCGYKFFTKNL